MIDLLFLSIVFLTPGLLIAEFLKTQKNILLTSSFSAFFWSLSALILEINYFINTYVGNVIISIVFLFWLLRFRNYQNLLYNLVFISTLEILNNLFGILHLVSTTAITLEAALENLNYVASSINVSAVQISFLKFFNNNYILATLPQYLSLSLLISNIITISKIKKISKKYILAIVPAFLIFCVTLEIMTIRSHFFSSQILCLLLIETFKNKEKRLNENIFFIFLCLFLSSRLENYYLYLPLLILLLTRYFDQENKTSMNLKLFLVSLLPVIINYNSLSGGNDLRGDIRISIALVLILNFFIVFRNKPLINFVVFNLNYFFMISIVLLGFINFVLYDFKAFHSWMFIMTHLLDIHRGWVIVTLYFLILLIYLIGFSNDIFEKRLFLNIFFTFVLIVISSPLHHSVYGFEQWSTGIIDGITIYNFFDESQTRSILQLFLSILPFSLIIMNTKKSNKD